MVESEKPILFCDGGEYDVNTIGVKVALECLPDKFKEKYVDYLKEESSKKRRDGR